MRLLLLAALLITNNLLAQFGVISGRVFNSANNEEVPFALVELLDTDHKRVTDIDGRYRFDSIPSKLYNVRVKTVGFYEEFFYDVEVNPAAPQILDLALRELADTLSGVTISATPFKRMEESPLSLKTLSAGEIKRYPGGNRDISKVIQSLPGVASTPSFRNDIIIRGGAPNENRFYLDGIEVPNINHFATQGSSGGPVGMINVNFIREVDFYSGSFPANRGNALSSVMEFKQRDGNSEKHTFSGNVGASDLGVSAEGPVNNIGNYLFSARRSYLQFVFAALQLPFLPTYNDAQFKMKLYLSNKDELSFIGLGAFDDFVLNTDANETEEQQYFLDNIPVNKQWNYAIGSRYRRFKKNGFTSLVLSRNYLNNRSYKFKDNEENLPENKILDYRSSEAEIKFRIEEIKRIESWKLSYGVGAENILYTNKTFSKRVINQGVILFDFNSRLTLNKYYGFMQLSRTYGLDRLVWSVGIRADGSDYSSSMSNPLDQFSPRLSTSIKVLPKTFISASIGRYYQIPAYTILGYRDNSGLLVNKENKVEYIMADHVVTGVEYNVGKSLKFTVEGFYKWYNKYPFLLDDSVSLANLGADFGVIGNSSVKSISSGQSRGIEFLMQQKLIKGFYGLIAYTFVFSEFTDKNGVLKASAWDNRHIVSFSAGKSFKRGWEVGFKWRYLGGAPYTPYDTSLSSLQVVWDVTGKGILDYDQLNSERLPSVHQLDIRIDKKYYFKKWMIELYLDIQNIYNFKAKLPDYFSVVRDNAGMPVADPLDASKYQTKFIGNTTGTILPSIGLQIEF